MSHAGKVETYIPPESREAFRKFRDTRVANVESTVYRGEILRQTFHLGIIEKEMITNRCQLITQAFSR